MRFMANHLITSKPPIPPAPQNLDAQPQLMQAGARGWAGPVLPVPEPLIEPISIRELDVLRLMAMGDSNAEIARKLAISLNTTKKHVTHIFGKLAVTDRSKAVHRARELRLVV